MRRVAVILRRRKKKKKRNQGEEDTRNTQDRERDFLELYDMKTAEQTAQSYFRMIFKR